MLGLRATLPPLPPPSHGGLLITALDGRPTFDAGVTFRDAVAATVAELRREIGALSGKREAMISAGES